jgi:hypothetical protein
MVPMAHGWLTILGITHQMINRILFMNPGSAFFPNISSLVGKNDVLNDVILGFPKK